VGKTGRVWIMTPWRMEGYGFPPDLLPRETRGGWWPSPDLGQLDEAGYLTLMGRIDDCFRTSAGYVVNPAAVAAVVQRYPGVTDMAVVPLGDRLAPVLGILVESPAELDLDKLRRHLARTLPAWSQPRVIETTTALPRLSTGRADRLACIAILEEVRSSTPADAGS